MSSTGCSNKLANRQEPESLSFFFSSPRHTLMAEKMYACLSGKSAFNSLPAQISLLHDIAHKAGQHNPVVVGAIPFDSRNPVYLGVPEKVLRSDSCRPGGIVVESPVNLAAPKVRLVPEPEVYKNCVREALSRFAKGELDKVVLSRTLEVEAESPVNIRQVLWNLASHNKTGYTFGIDVPCQKENSNVALLGASPELLVSRKGQKVIANPLAGSAARSKDPVEDQRRAEALLKSAKDLHEHAVVVDAVASALSSFCTDFKVPEQPSLIKTETMWHLSTVVEGTLKEPETSSLQLATALHPTPAVCGYPTHKARQFITENEPFDRGFFTGMVGWCDARGDGEWVVTIRCAEIKDAFVRLYAGAGVVAASDPDSELAETGAKFRTMLNAIGLDKNAGAVQ
ncbi:isochorismate synthase DhbC [Endozoicomonas sp. Mp262]|uniref:isochorismate synthase DhbC n=1 Tax=Endozoicomonas sp. Mp262 TaxID=2919499 RepID=UPI0021DB6B7E